MNVNEQIKEVSFFPIWSHFRSQKAQIYIANFSRVEIEMIIF